MLQRGACIINVKPSTKKKAIAQRRGCACRKPTRCTCGLISVCVGSVVIVVIAIYIIYIIVSSEISDENHVCLLKDEANAKKVPKNVKLNLPRGVTWNTEFKHLAKIKFTCANPSERFYAKCPTEYTCVHGSFDIQPIPTCIQRTNLTLKTNKRVYYQGNDVVFTCNLFPKNGRAWKAKLERIDGDENISSSFVDVMNNTLEAMFTLTDVQVENAGKYRCVAETKDRVIKTTAKELKVSVATP